MAPLFVISWKFFNNSNSPYPASVDTLVRDVYTSVLAKSAIPATHQIPSQRPSTPPEARCHWRTLFVSST